MDKTPEMNFRVAEPGDETSIAEVHVLAWQIAYRGMIPDTYLDGLSVTERIATWRQILSELDPPSRSCYVAFRDSRLTGFVHCCPSRDIDAAPTTGEVTAIYVHPNHWGEGVGRGLLKLAVENLNHAGFNSATLWVLDVNARARRFYEEAGWLSNGTTKRDARRRFTLNEVQYARSIP